MHILRCIANQTLLQNPNPNPTSFLYTHSMLPLPPLPRLRTILGIIALFLGMGFLVYGWSLWHPFVRWDDGMLIFENPAIRQISPATLKWIFTHFDPELYIPLTFFSYQIDYLIGGIHPFQYHLDNTVLHILNAVLVAFILYALIKRQWLALFCGLLFLLHPLNTEGVEWASGRKDVLSTFFMLASIASYFLYQDKASWKWYIFSLALFVLGLLSKVMIITLPVVLVLLDYARYRKWDRSFVVDKIPYFFLSIVFGLIGILGKQGVIASSNISEKLLMAFKSTAFYVQQFVWPFHFSLLYPFNGTITLLSPAFFVPVIIVLLMLAAALFLRNRIRLITLGILFYFITVAPTLLNFAKGEMDIYFASDRYAYVPQIGLIVVLACLIGISSEWLERTFGRRSVETGGIIIGLLLLCILGGLAYRQSLVWKDTESLFQNVIVQYPDASYVAYNNLCNSKRLAGDLAGAVEDCTQSLAVRPHAKTYSNLGAVYRKQKNYTAALDVYQKGITLDPKSAYPHFGLGIVYAEMGQYDKAEIEYLKAIALRPEYADAYLNLGALYAVELQYDKAIEEYNKALAINAFHPTALFNLAVAEAESGKTADATRDYERAIAADPTLIAARINLGLLYYNAGKTDDAILQFEAVLKIDPTNTSARSALTQLGAL